MPYIRLDQIEFSIGTHVLLDKVNLTLDKGERLGLLGRNGAGKSTLMRILSGELAQEDGERWVDPNITVARLDQALPEDLETTVFDYVATGLAKTGALLSRYQALISDSSGQNLGELSQIQSELEHLGGWSMAQRIEKILQQLGLNADERFATLSGGWRRRAALARALVIEPDVLLLDEPTNHLDIPSIDWLEQQVNTFEGAIVLITHDRRFLQRVCNRIGELDRGHLSLWQADYSKFLVLREQQAEATARQEALFDKKLAQEETWIRQGIKARRTRNEGRVRALKAMREERAQRRVAQGKGSFALEEANRSGRRVAEARGISFRYANEPVVNDFSTIIQRGDRIGIVGCNGVGKTTVIKLLLGELKPDQGDVLLGTQLEIAYSDQLRGELDPDKDLIDNICGGQQFVEVNGQRRHAISYLGDFLFAPDRIRTPVKALSGGEINRAILARLFTRPANVLILDEPTNDLDIETLELLEEILLEFKGTIILVSHDRHFLDKVVTSLLVMSGNGDIDEHAGSYSDWEARGARQEAPTGSPMATQAIANPSEADIDQSERPAKPTPYKGIGSSTRKQKTKLSYKEQRELDALPGEIEILETRHAELLELIAQPDFYKRSPDDVAATLTAVTESEQSLDRALERLVELEG
ncbi:ATP-binding cassette domain-containing protein [Luminiphilus sp.]|nr:ATP-binding cassette domain-containing protein [Luminiphilus sp.]MDA9710966.1 ATP-binding cassette domain-containing protein [Luminiphilus sp.]